jgi:hypothetical protein
MRKQYAVLAIVMSISLAAGWEATAPIRASEYNEVLSFDMWCLEMRLYPSARCDSRKPDDIKAYEQYRAKAERYDQERGTRAKRDLELKQKLDRNTPKLGTFGK